MGAAIGIAVPIACDMWLSCDLTLVWAYRSLLVLVALPFAIMLLAAVIAFGLAILVAAPLVTVIFITLVSSWLRVPWEVVAGIVLTGIVVWTAYKIYRPNHNPLTFRMYEFGADNIVPYYRWLFAPQRAPVVGVVTGLGIWVLVAWGMSR